MFYSSAVHRRPFRQIEQLGHGTRTGYGTARVRTATRLDDLRLSGGCLGHIAAFLSCSADVLWLWMHHTLLAAPPAPTQALDGTARLHRCIFMWSSSLQHTYSLMTPLVPRRRRCSLHPDDGGHALCPSTPLLLHGTSAYRISRTSCR